ncbi:hypothetical protein ONZ45_g984 [Pleurotus djamor]|nr:hypothetical protein ONZ45_g984 [Pleurotus djamor]
MSSSAGTSALPGSKKRRLQGACDICRYKKIKCMMVEVRLAQDIVEDLQLRIKKLEALLNNITPAETPSNLPNSSNAAQDTLLCYTAGTNKEPSFLSSPPQLDSDLSSTSPQSSSDIPEQEDEMHLVDEFKRLHILQDDARFFGKSSSFVLLQTALGVKQECTDDTALRPSDFRRSEYWEIPEYERDVTATTRQTVAYTFPEPDLMQSVMDLYFKTSNLIIPLLHEPTFKAQVASGLHLRDEWFGSVLLTVCALGSRYSTDPRVLLEGSNTWHSCGWKWFSQIRVIRQSVLETPSLYELQFYTLAVLYYQGSSNPQGCWVMVGLGVRYAQEVGAHRRKVRSEKPTVHDELWKRAFWLLVIMDRMVSAFVGRPCALHEEDYDVEYPLEVDDEYWTSEDPDLAFKQPPGTISKMTAFNLMLKLVEILAVALRALYSANKSRLWVGVMGPNWEQRVVSELDSELNSWLDSVPDALRWSGHNPSSDPRLFSLSANLFCTYYYVQILIHRPFISGVLKTPGLSFPSLAICVNAARACSHLLNVYVSEGFMPPAPTCQMAAFTSGIVLLINIWSAKKSRASFNVEKEMADVNNVLHVLEIYETRWRIAGRLRDMVACLAGREELAIPQIQPRTNKRRLSEDAASRPDMILKNEDYLIGDKYKLGVPPPATSIPTQPVVPREVLPLPSQPSEPLVHQADGFGSYGWSDVDLSAFFAQNALSPFSSQLSQPTEAKQNIPQPPFHQPSIPLTQPSINSITPDIPMSNGSHAPFGNLFDEGGKMMDLWSAIPGSFDVDEWGGYLATLDAEL